jgi:hypothetical protein
MTAIREVQLPKQDRERTLTDDGMVIDSNDEQDLNTDSSMQVRFVFAPNAKESREMHPSKQATPINSTNGGREIDLNERQLEKALSPIRLSCEFDSNVTL